MMDLEMLSRSSYSEDSDVTLILSNVMYLEVALHFL